jgi:3-methyladenine DNA glycosylase AlkD
MTPARPPIAQLQLELAANADAEKRAWWERYLKGEAEFRGVPTPVIRSSASAWWDDHDAGSLDSDGQLELCMELLRCPMTEDKLAGMLILGERLIPAGGVDWAGATASFATLFAERHLADWNAVDWFCVRVLGPLIEFSGEACARAIAAWVSAKTLWQRRAALVGFVNLAPSGSYAELIVETADCLVLDHERFAQTGVAWVIRELSTSRPDLSEDFLRRHYDDMSPDARKQALGKRRDQTMRSGRTSSSNSASVT